MQKKKNRRKLEIYINKGWLLFRSFIFFTHPDCGESTELHGPEFMALVLSAVSSIETLTTVD